MKNKVYKVKSKHSANHCHLVYDDVVLKVLLVVFCLAIIKDLGVHPVCEAYKETSNTIGNVDALVIQLS